MGDEVKMDGFEKFLSDLKQVRSRVARHFNGFPLLTVLPPSQVMSAEKPFTVILDDPMSNSYLQNPCESLFKLGCTTCLLDTDDEFLDAPDADPNMKIEMYNRSFEQNEELGLNDMQVEVRCLSSYVHEGALETDLCYNTQGYEGEKEAQAAFNMANAKIAEAQAAQAKQ